MSRAALVISLIALVVALWPRFQGDEVPAAASGVAEEGSLEVAVYMGRLQRFHQKWWASGRAGNAELAAFYLHEMEEAMEEIAEGGVIDDGVDVSKHMRTYGLAVVAELERLLAEEGVEAMIDQGAMLVNSCNSCHAVTGHPAIRIRVPAAVHFPDQSFDP